LFDFFSFFTKFQSYGQRLGLHYQDQDPTTSAKADEFSLKQVETKAKVLTSLIISYFAPGFADIVFFDSLQCG